tara:strand:- start:225 stop:395 length:171 start_codon:yes stop_codon:yes gene_type:complete
MPEVTPPPDFRNVTLGDLIKEGYATEAAKKAVETWCRIERKVEHAKQLRGFVWKLQ